MSVSRLYVTLGEVFFYWVFRVVFGYACSISLGVRLFCMLYFLLWSIFRGWVIRVILSCWFSFVSRVSTLLFFGCLVSVLVP